MKLACQFCYLMVVIFILACNNNKSVKQTDTYKTTITFNPGDENKIVEALLTLKNSSQVKLNKGTYKFDNLSLAQVKHVLFKGDGFDKTILDFTTQSGGGEGIRVTDVVDFAIEGMTIQNAKGDLLKINKSSNVTIGNLHAIWKTSDSTNGGYGIYPVLCKNVLIENCYVQGASDAGIYVGQSDSAIVRNCKAYKNVAGCEIENTTNSEVYNNEFWGNTAGFLIFDLPGLSKRGGHVKGYNNYIHDNNERNFAKAGSFGTNTGVGNVSPGTGICILSVSNVEVYNNRIINNNASAVTIASGLAIDDKALTLMNEAYFPFSRNIKIYDNEIQIGASFPEPAFKHKSGQVFVGVEQKLNALESSRTNKRIPPIFYDGISTNVLNKGTTSNPDSICIQQTGDDIFVNANMLAIRDQKNWRPSTDVSPFNCR